MSLSILWIILSFSNDLSTPKMIDVGTDWLLHAFRKKNPTTYIDCQKLNKATHQIPAPSQLIPLSGQQWVNELTEDVTLLGVLWRMSDQLSFFPFLFPIDCSRPLGHLRQSRGVDWCLFHLVDLSFWLVPGLILCTHFLVFSTPLPSSMHIPFAITLTDNLLPHSLLFELPHWISLTQWCVLLMS